MTKKYTLLLLLLIFQASFAQSDCADAIVVCGNSGFSGLTVTGIGTQELGTGITCGSSENNSIWIRLDIATSGTLGFTLVPESNDINEDFDFFIFGPNVSCGNLGPVKRCSTTNPFAAQQGDNHTGLNATETDVSEGPGEAGNSFLSMLDVIAGESYFLVVDRPVGTSNFSINWTGTGGFNDPPIFDLPSGTTTLDIGKCDDDNIDDRITEFNLEQNTPLIIGNQSNVTVTYYTTQNDAFVGTNAIANTGNFLNTQNPQTIYTRIENNTTHCFANAEFKITLSIVFPFKESVTCDSTEIDNDDTNGQAVFDLEKVTQDVFAGIAYDNLNISYYLNQDDADHDRNPLPRFFHNTVPDVQTIIIKASNGDCSDTVAIRLIVNPLPQKITGHYFQCDSGEHPDGLTTFELHRADGVFTTANPGIEVEYFGSMSDVQNNLPLPAFFDNTVNPQAVIVRQTNPDTQCISYATLMLHGGTDDAQPDIVLNNCDVYGQENGFTTFNLDDSHIALTGGQMLAYYNTPQDAVIQQHAITNTTTFPNPVAYESFVYARIDDGGLNCSMIRRIRLVVNTLPDIEEQSDGNDFVCLNKPDEFITIDAAVRDPFFADYEYLWEYNSIPFHMNTYSVQVNHPGTYKVTVIKPTGCRKVRTVEVFPSSDATIDSVDIQDITFGTNTVTVNLTPDSIGQYVYSLDNPSGPFQDSNFFDNVASGIHTVYVKDVNGCGMVSRLIAVLGIPEYFTPNGDGVHDSWRIDGVDTVFNSDTNVLIFDRFGKFIKEIAKNDTGGWDGTFLGRPLPSDDYWYVLNLEDGRTIKGHFALRR
ncbi:T9SS type B sorting domain-containing protein [Flavobacterium magnum]|nr:T9SS type B sorting domain-containing protein [Flavobacterium magnum]